jgi:hypothetical protein
MAQVIRVPFDDQQIGQGFNFDSGENVGTALAVASVAVDPVVDGSIVRTSFSSVTTQESLMEALGISASADARYGLFAADAKINFAQSHAINSFSSFVAGRCEVQNATRHGRGFSLTPEAAALITAGNLKAFKTAFGDMFVRSLKTGGEFFVVARITSTSEVHQSQLAAKLHAAYNGLATAGDFKAAFSEAATQTSGRTDVTVFMSQAGGVGGQLSFTGPDAARVLERLSEFPQTVREHPVGYEAEIASYDTLAFPAPSPEESEDRDIVLADCLRLKLNFLKALADLQFAQAANAGSFFEALPAPAELAALESQYRIALNGLMAHAIRVANGKLTPPQVFVPDPAPSPLTLKKRQSAAGPAGTWAMAFEGGGESVWTFAANGDQQFEAREDGLGNARGVAVLTGRRAVLNWAASNPGDATTGQFVLDFNETFTMADATVQFFTVHVDKGILHGRFIRTG